MFNQTIEKKLSKLAYHHGIKLGLSRITKLLKLLDNPQDSFKSIHIAGTNGKGTVVYQLSEMLRKNKLKVGSYYSPHIKTYRERFQINGEMISIKDFEKLFRVVWRASGKVKGCTEFEILTAMAFLYFKQKKVESAVVETGLGGRFDATNVLNPQLSIITSIQMDHESILGNSIKQIAKEKAGIIKKNVPVLVGQVPNKVRSIFSSASKKIFFVKRKSKESNWEFNGKLAFSGAKLIGVHVGTRHVASPHEPQLSPREWEGRLQTLHKNPTIIFDGAHNPSSIKQLIKDLKQKFPKKKINYFMGILARKNGKEMTSLIPGKIGWIDIPGEQNFPLASLNGKVNQKFKNHKEAIAWIKKKGRKSEIYCLTGSFYLLNDNHR